MRNYNKPLANNQTDQESPELAKPLIENVEESEQSPGYSRIPNERRAGLDGFNLSQSPETGLIIAEGGYSKEHPHQQSDEKQQPDNFDLSVPKVTSAEKKPLPREREVDIDGNKMFVVEAEESDTSRTQDNDSSDGEQNSESQSRDSMSDENKTEELEVPVDSVDLIDLVEEVEANGGGGEGEPPSPEGPDGPEYPVDDYGKGIRGAIRRRWDQLKVGVGNVMTGNVRRRNVILGALAGAAAGVAIWKITGDHDSANTAANSGLGPDNTLAAHNGQDLHDVLRNNGYDPNQVLPELSDIGYPDQHGPGHDGILSQHEAHSAARNLQADPNAPSGFVVENADRGEDGRIFVSEDVQEVLNQTPDTGHDATDPIVAAAIGGGTGAGIAYLSTRSGERSVNPTPEQDSAQDQDETPTVELIDPNRELVDANELLALEIERQRRELIARDEELVRVTAEQRRLLVERDIELARINEELARSAEFRTFIDERLSTLGQEELLSAFQEWLQRQQTEDDEDEADQR